MATGTQPRLAAILHADVVGSTALVRKDEQLAHERIHATFRNVGKFVDCYGGTVNEVRGDALVAEFPRPSDAVLAALAAQGANLEHVAALNDELAPVLRIGIALGEVVIADATVTGVGVVLAQRLEQLSEPGGVCVSGAVREATPDRLGLRFESFGAREIKGFDEPVLAYAVSVPEGVTVPSPQVSATTPKRGRDRLVHWIAAGGAAALLTLAVVAGFAPWRPTVDPVPVERFASLLPERPSIAVLPFDNLSEDPEQEYFSDGMTDDLITELSKLKGLFVVARNSAFTFKGRSVKARDIAAELGVRYVLEGSVRRAGNKVRINAQLIDGVSGGHLWAERYDGSLDDIFSLQDRVTGRIVVALHAALTPQEENEAASHDTESIEAYDEFLRGLSLQARRSPEDAARALEHFRRSVELDPEFVRAHAAMAQLYWDYSLDNEFVRRIGWLSENTLVDTLAVDAWQLLQKAQDKPLAQALALSARQLARQRRYPESLARARQAVEVGPNDPAAHDALIEMLIFSGKVEKAISHIEESLALDPKQPGEKLFLKGLALYVLERRKDAVELLERARAHNPRERRYLVIEAAIRSEMGQTRQAAGLLSDYSSRVNARLTGNWIVQRWPFRSRSVMRRLVDALLAIGVTPSADPLFVSEEDRLSAGELRELLSGKVMVGVDQSPSGLEAEFEVKRDDRGQITEQGFLTYFETRTGKTRIENDLLCDPWLKFGEYCVAVYRNREGTLETRSEYAFFTVTGPFTFSVLDSDALPPDPYSLPEARPTTKSLR